MMHQVLDDSDQMRKNDISESIIQALIMTLLQTMSYYRACIMDQRCHTFSFGHYHQAPGASCGILYYPGLVSCPFYAIPIYPF